MNEKKTASLMRRRKWTL